jgi:hypothetical protein
MHIRIKFIFHLETEDEMENRGQNPIDTLSSEENAVPDALNDDLLQGNNKLTC